ncbi:MAG: BamA/TamA family outer membrane protein [Flavobacteriales bacterium]|nr:BamA/TamA family outer membrane protein [Flavobacteriales bacterium]
MFPICNPTKYVKPNELFLQKNKVSIDNRKIDKDNIASIIKQKPNRKILGLFRFHLGLHNIISQNIGEAPVIYDSLLTDRTVKQLKLYTSKRGYFENEVTYSSIIKKNKIKVEYDIKTGPLYTIKSVEYVFADDEIKDKVYFIMRKTLADLKPGNPFDVDLLNQQRDKIKTEMKNQGYYYFNKDYVKYKVDSTIGNKEIAIFLHINNPQVKNELKDTIIEKKHNKYYINDINVYISKNLKNKSLDHFDTLSFKEISVNYEDKLKYRARMLNHSIGMKKGNLFLLNDQISAYKHLSELNLFKNVSISYDDIGNNQLNTNIFLTPSKRKSFAIEAIGKNNGGNLGIEGNFIYQNKNLFKGGEHLTVKLKGGLEIQQLINNDQEDDNQFLGIFNTFEFGPEVNLEFPRFLLPISLEKFSRRMNPKTNLNLLLNFQTRPEYTRSLTQATFGYFWNESRFKKHFINLMNISVIDLRPSIDFQKKLDEESNPFILNSFQNHFINSTSYTFIYNNQRVNKAVDFNYLKATFEFAGNIQSGINKLKNKPFDNIDSESYNFFGIRYAQFVKVDLDFRSYGQTKTTSFVKRINIGIGKPYGNLDALPFEKSYYGGGANDIRAWQVRSLGPGSLPDSLTQNALNQIGELKIEANAEYRFDLTKVVEGAVFVDAGNIWLLAEDPDRPNAEFKVDKFWNDLAIGTGLGIRLDFNFFLIRFDLAAKLKDPGSDIPEKFKLNWRKPTLNLGIGYPF